MRPQLLAICFLLETLISNDHSSDTIFVSQALVLATGGSQQALAQAPARSGISAIQLHVEKHKKNVAKAEITF